MITLSTIVYEGNFRKLLNSDSWFLKIKSKYITKKRLNVNNISSIEEFQYLLSQLNENIEISYVDLKSQEANQYFKLNTEINTHGYNYIMPYFTDLLTIDTEYIFNVASDCQMDISVSDDFFEKSIKILNEDDEVLVTTIPWGHPNIFGTKYTRSAGDSEQEHADSIDNNRNHSIKRSDDFWFSKTFSDQVFIAKIDQLRKTDFTIISNLHPYPSYGGLSFEMRLGNNLMVNNKYRAIIKSNDYYSHGKD